MQILERILQFSRKQHLPQRSMSPCVYSMPNNDVDRAWLSVFTEGSRRCENLERFEYVSNTNERSVHDYADSIISGRKRLEIQRNWKGDGPSVVVEHKSTSLEWSHVVHRIKVDELAGYIMTTSNQGGILVTGLDEDRILWALPSVCKQFHHYHFLIIHPI